jgi:hypothetical protein
VQNVKEDSNSDPCPVSAAVVFGDPAFTHGQSFDKGTDTTTNGVGSLKPPISRTVLTLSSDLLPWWLQPCSPQQLRLPDPELLRQRRHLLRLRYRQQRPRPGDPHLGQRRRQLHCQPKHVGELVLIMLKIKIFTIPRSGLRWFVGDFSALVTPISRLFSLSISAPFSSLHFHFRIHNAT